MTKRKRIFTLKDMTKSQRVRYYKEYNKLVGMGFRKWEAITMARSKIKYSL